MNIKILGGGCANCHKLEENTRKAIKELNIEAVIDGFQENYDLWSYGNSRFGH